MSGVRQAWLPILCLLAAVWLVFGKTAAAQFVAWDDPDMVWQNPRLNPPTFDKTLGFWRQPDLGLYTPLPYTAWSAIAAMEHLPPDQVLRPAPFHLFNLLLHSAAAVFVFLLLRELVGADWSAWAGAMVFALHPLQAEPVGWVAGMNNLMCGAFGAAALWQYVLHAKRPDAAMRHWLIATALFAAALLSKTTAVVFPLVAAMLDLFVLCRPWRTVVKALVVWLAMMIAMALLARRVQPSVLLHPPSIGGRLLVAVDAIGFYLGKLFLPFHLTIDYERTPQWLLDHPWAAWPGLAVLLPAAICLLSRRTAWLRAGILVVPLALLPVLGLTPFDFQAYSTETDRYMYIPMLGVALIAAQAMVKARGHLIPWTVAGIVLTLLAARSFDQAGIWMDSESLSGQQLRIDPDSATGQKILAHSLTALNRDQEAEAHFRAAIAALAHQNPPADGAVWYDYANLLMREHRYGEAIEQYQIAISRFPPGAAALAYNNLGIAYYRGGNHDAARAAFQRALALRPDFIEVRKNLELLDQH